LTYTAAIFRDADILSVKTGLKRRHAFRLRSQIRERGFRWDVWLQLERPSRDDAWRTPIRSGSKSSSSRRLSRGTF
jgi:hypothetical protein